MQVKKTQLLKITPWIFFFHCWKHLEINGNPAVLGMDKYVLAVICFDHCIKEKY